MNNAVIKNEHENDLLKKVAEYKILVGKQYQVGDTVWISGVIGSKLPSMRSRFKIDGIAVLDNEEMFVGRPECFDSRHYVPWYYIEGYEFTCPVCGQTALIKGSHSYGKIKP